MDEKDKSEIERNVEIWYDAFRKSTTGNAVRDGKVTEEEFKYYGTYITISGTILNAIVNENLSLDDKKIHELHDTLLPAMLSAYIGESEDKILRKIDRLEKIITQYEKIEFNRQKLFKRN